jgi:hypothetical protein
VRKYRLLRVKSRHQGSATIDVIAALVLLIALTLGGVQIALTLYARNVLIAATHDGARRGIELGRTADEATDLARSFVESAAGGLVRDANVSAEAREMNDEFLLRVRITGTIEVPGPIPLGIPFDARATTSRALRPSE